MAVRLFLTAGVARARQDPASVKHPTPGRKRVIPPLDNVRGFFLCSLCSGLAGFIAERRGKADTPSARLARNLLPLHLRWMPSCGWIAADISPTGGQNHESIDNACPRQFGTRTRY